MTLSNLPSALARPISNAGRVVSKLMLDLTVYLMGPSEDELDFLIDCYEGICPQGRLKKFKIAEFSYWSDIANPDLTASARAAAAAGAKRPHLEPVRRRLRDGRAFEVQFWDGREIQDPDGSWSFSCQQIHLRATGLHAFVRILVPLEAEATVLLTAAGAIADRVQLHSGHAGLVFVYDPWFLGSAFDGIYARARRFWGVDVEHLNDTLPLMRTAIKGINWITLIGSQFTAKPEIQAGLDALAEVWGVGIEKHAHATVLAAGSRPAVGDQHRHDSSLDSYYAIANALGMLYLDAHPDFPGERWILNGNTVGWIRRFLDPSGWR